MIVQTPSGACPPEEPAVLINDLLTFAAVMDVVRGAIMTLFIISAFLVILIVLAQEGKGGGLAGAFGGAGTETFGVKAGTVNTATAWVGAAFLGLALLYAGLSNAESAPTQGVDKMEGLPGDSAPEEPGKDGDAKDGDAKDGDAKDGDSKDEGGSDDGAKDEGAKDEGSKDDGSKDGSPKDGDDK